MYRFLGPFSRSSDSVCLGCGLMIYVSNKLPGDTEDDTSVLENVFREPLLYCMEYYNIVNSQYSILICIVFLKELCFNIITPGLPYSKRGHKSLSVLSKWFSGLAPFKIGHLSWKRQAKPQWQFYKERNHSDSRQFLPSRKGVSHSITSVELWWKGARWIAALWTEFFCFFVFSCSSKDIGLERLHQWYQ